MLDAGDTMVTETDMGPAHRGNTISQMATQKDGDWFLLNHGQLMKGEAHHKAKKQKPNEKNICDLYGKYKANVLNIQLRSNHIMTGMLSSKMMQKKYLEA